MPYDLTQRAEIRRQQEALEPAAGASRGASLQLQKMSFAEQMEALAPSSSPVQGAALHGLRGAGDVQAIAAEGIRGAGQQLPHLDAIQASFGRHDVTNMRAHVGGSAGEAARAIQAKAFATGADAGFDGQPDLRLAAHEAAHKVQQENGCVQLRGGVGEVGDRYERHADRVADLVVSGRSAEGTLDEMTGSGGAGAATQCKSVQAFGGFRGVVRGIKNGAGRINTGGGQPAPGWGGAGTLAYNSRGPEVEQLQTNLNTLGESLVVDGHFGRNTWFAVRRFQSANGLAVDGIVGPNTRAAMEAALSGQGTTGAAIDDDAVECPDCGSQFTPAV